MRTFFSQREWLAPLIHLSNNWISLAGVLLTTTGGVSWLFVLPLQFGEAADHPYLGILFYLLLPTVFFLGLALIPLGIYLRMRREQRAGSYPHDWPPVNWKNAEFRRLLTFISIATILNVLIGGQLTYAGVEYVDSVSFCGQACHSVMKPEFTAYQDSPHFHVSCTECHIGSGASWFVRSKLSGVRQVFAVALDNHSRPIEAPVHDLRPARDTCEACHWPARFSGYRLRIIDKFAADEHNTPAKTVLLMKIGGGQMVTGIHGFHLNDGVEVTYASDRSRQTIPWVRYTDASGQVTEYKTEEWDGASPNDFETRTMDCIDCHNRPTHTFELAERALDRALAEGRIDSSLPFVKQQGLEILQREYASTEEVDAKVPAALENYYRSEHPEIYAARKEAVEQAARGLLAVHSRNVFPEMKVTWGTYPNNVGHTDFPGCFRCHDDLHTSAEGKTISQDCSSCHELLAMDETNPEVLKQLGIAP